MAAVQLSRPYYTCVSRRESSASKVVVLWHTESHAGILLCASRSGSSYHVAKNDPELFGVAERVIGMQSPNLIATLTFMQLEDDMALEDW